MAERMEQIYPRRVTILTEVDLLDLRAISDARRVVEAYAARLAEEHVTHVETVVRAAMRHRGPETPPRRVDALSRAPAPPPGRRAARP